MGDVVVDVWAENFVIEQPVIEFFRASDVKKSSEQ